MCGIPILPPDDATEGAKLTFAQALRHVGGARNLITENGHRLIDLNRRDYLWKYPGHAFCTYCGADVGDFRGRHNAEVSCPACGREVIFKHESRGHGRIFDEFCLYEWRKSVIDRETLVLTAAFVKRDSRWKRPEREPLDIMPSAIYIFRPGRAVTVYKRDYYNTAACDLIAVAPLRIRAGATSRGASVGCQPGAAGACPLGSSAGACRAWSIRQTVAPAHTEYMGGRMDIVQDYGAFREALRGTRIGATFAALCDISSRRDTLELTAIANCARRPWLEYLHKCGQGELAAALMRYGAVSREIIPRPRAKSPRALLGVTEAQWHEIRRDHVKLTAELLTAMARLRRMGLGDMHMGEILAIVSSTVTLYWLNCLAPSVSRAGWREETACDILRQAAVPEKLIKKAMRRIVTRDLRHAQEWVDYYAQLRRLGEDLTDTALLLPKDMPAMHQRMIDRENLLRDQAEARRLRGLEAGHRKRLRELRREYAFEARGLILRPYETAAEVIAEGTALGICIGSYAERYLRGYNIICCLRQANEPDEPWRAVEFSASTGRLVQDRGYHNDTRGGVPPGTQHWLDLFWADFERHRKQLQGRKHA